MKAYVIMKNDFPEHVIVSTNDKSAKRHMARFKKVEQKDEEMRVGISAALTALERGVHWHIEEVDVDIL